MLAVLADQMASELINLPDTMEDMQLLLLTYREDLIAAKLGKERAEEKLRSDVTQLKGLLVSEQQSKAGVERQLRGEIHDLNQGHHSRGDQVRCCSRYVQYTLSDHLQGGVG